MLITLVSTSHATTDVPWTALSFARYMGSSNHITNIDGPVIISYLNTTPPVFWISHTIK